MSTVFQLLLVFIAITFGVPILVNLIGLWAYLVIAMAEKLREIILIKLDKWDI